MVKPKIKRPPERVKTKRTNLTMPPDWYDAFEAAATAANQPVSEWLRDAGLARLPAAIRSRLSPDHPRGRPRKELNP